MIRRTIRPADRLLASALGARRLADLALICGILAAACTVGFAIGLARAIASVFVGGERLDGVLPLLVGAGLLALARAALVAFQEILGQRASSRLGTAVRRDLLETFVARGPAWSGGERVGEVVRATSSGLDALDAWVTSYRPARLLAALVPVLVLLVILVLDPPTALVLVLTGPVLVLLLAVIGSRAHAITRRRFEELRWMSAFFVDMLRGIATLKAFGRSREQVANIRSISGRLGDTTMDVLRTAFQTALVLEWAAAVATAVVATEVSLRLMAGQMTFETAIAVLIVTPEFFLPLRALAIRYHAGSAGETAAERLLELGAGREEAAGAVSAGGTVGPASVRTPVATTRERPPAIELEDAWFAYPDRSPALRGLTLAIGPGELVALVGPSGAGKSTIAHLLLRFAEPDHGTIRIDGVPLGDLDVTSWRRSIAWVPQRPHLLAGTVAGAIRVGRPDASMADVIAAAEAAQADEMIRALPNAYEAAVGEGGQRLSGGQRQRLVLARAFLRKAPLVVLDEPTSHLDADSEAAIADAIRSHAAGRTVILIAHRPRLAAIADRVVRIDAGAIVDEVDPSGPTGQVPAPDAAHQTAHDAEGGLVAAGPA
jgi:thiol reductant ABC exporter CydD subunit